MKEESDLDILHWFFHSLDFGSQHSGQQHQMVIVHPDEITIFERLHNGFGEIAVGFPVSFPMGLIETNFTRMVMKQRP